MANTINTLAGEVGNALSILGRVLQSSARAKGFINALGWQLPPGVEDLGLAGLDLTTFLERLEVVVESSEREWEDEILMAARIADLIEATADLIQQITHIAEELPTQLAGFGDYVSRTNIHKELPKRAFDLLVIGYLSDRSPLLFALLHLLNIVEFRHFEADEENFQIEHVRAIVEYGRISDLLSDPTEHMRKAYGWGTPEFSDLDLLSRFAEVLKAVGATVRMQPLDFRAEAALVGQPVPDGAMPKPQMIIKLYEDLREISGLMVGLSVFGVRPSTVGGSDGGIGFLPLLRGQAVAEIPIYAFENTFLEFSADAELLKRISVIQRPGLPAKVQRAKTLGDLAAGRFALGIRFGEATAEPKTIASFPGGSSLSIQQFRLMGGIDKGAGDSIETFFEVSLIGCKAVFSLSEADGFLSSTISRRQLEAPFDLRVGWSKTKGIYFDGSAGLELTLPLNLNLGPIYLQLLHVALAAKDGGLDIEASTSGNLTIGPVLATVDRLGVNVGVSFDGGNLGLFDLSSRFKPPEGVGLLIDSQGIRGGGFLRIDAPNYAGVLELNYRDQIDLTAFALITTRLPDGQPGFSLVISILAEFQPVQLGLGFALSGVGGLIGINRQFNEEALKQAFKTHSLDAVLFPSNPIKDAVKLLDTLQGILPAREGYHVLGPMAKLFWGGSLRLVNFEIGIFIQLGGPLKLVLLGQAWTRLPKEETPLLVINVDVLGIIDFGEERVAFDATLYDSRIMGITLDGQMALRADWSQGEENFALSVGGFHPQFQEIPPGFPALRRLAMVMGENPRLTLTMYLAITTNTLQVGAKLELWAQKLGFTITGGASFDALFTFSPFSFLVTIKVWVNVKRGWIDLGLWLELELSGPNPIVAAGYVKIKLGWFFSVKVRFRAEFGEKVAEALPEVSPLAALKKELQQPRAVKAQLPGWASTSVAFTESGEAKVDGLADLLIVQDAVPLNLTMEKYGGGKPAGEEKRLRVTTGVRGERAEQRLFAAEQFKNWTVEERLAAKPFERYDAGVSFGGEYVLPEAHREERQIVFETVLRESAEYLGSLPETDYRKVGVRTACLWQPKSVQTELLANWAQFGSVSYYRRGRTVGEEKTTNYVRVKEAGYGITGGTTSAGEVMTFAEALEVAKSDTHVTIVMRKRAETTDGNKRRG